jgi:hypothetical protein
MKRFLLLLFLLVAFLVGIAHLFQLRFESGDIYPPYSSLRSDPLGTRALYESLQQLMPVHRHFRTLDLLRSGTNTAVFLLGATPNNLELPLAEVRGLEEVISKGAQLILTFTPRDSGKQTRPAPPGTAAQVAPDTINLLKRWGADWSGVTLPAEVKSVMATSTGSDERLPSELRCHTALHFTDLDPVWNVIYERETNLAVLVERSFGQGRIVACADAFWLSNEGLSQERPTGLLVWLLGPTQRAIFDEAHLGVTEQPGVAMLMRRYRLHALVGCVVLLAVLFAWKNAASFLPIPEEKPEELIQGRETTVGVINLLRRSIAAPELLAVCLEEWKKSCSKQTSTKRLQRLQALVDQYNQTPPRQRQPTETYRQISRILLNK